MARKQKPSDLVPRDKHKNRAPLWFPTEDQINEVALLAELGHNLAGIGSHLDITHNQLAGAFVRLPGLKEAYDDGLERRKDPLYKKVTWVPSPKDLIIVEEAASEQMTKDAIAAKLGISRQVFALRFNDTPLLREAYERGDGARQEEITRQFVELQRDRHPDLKHMTAPLIFLDKALCGRSDRPDLTAKPLKVEHTGTVKVNTTINLPETVKVENFASFSEQEMERAKRIAMERDAQKQLHVVDATSVIEIAES